MTYQRKPGDGTLWENGYKNKDTHPDMRGDFLHIDGQEYEVAAWKKATRDGEPYLSLKVQPKRAKPDDRRPERRNVDDEEGLAMHGTPPAKPDFDDDLPF